MRVILVSLGTLGDIHPFIAVAIELRTAGHVPVLAAAEPCRPIAGRHDIEFHPIRPDAAEVMADTGLDEAGSARAVVSDLGFVIDKVVLPYAGQTLADLKPLMANADLAICSSFSILGRIAAGAAGVPVLSLLLQPMTLFSADDPPIMPTGSAFLCSVRHILGAWAVGPLLDLARLATRRQLRPFAKLREMAGAPPVAGSELIDGPLAAEHVIALWSSEFAPLPRDVPGNVTLTGFTFYDGGFSGAPLTPDLLQFLDRGARPVVFTLGSLAVYSDDGFFAASASAAREIGVRAVLLVGDDLIEQHRHLSSHDVFVAGYAPHSAIFDRAAAVVHHGGIGTIAQAMRAGLPQLVCPIFGDQFDNAARLRRRGLARILPKTDYNVERVIRELGALLEDADVSRNAKSVGVAVGQENGARVAMAVLALLNDGQSKGPQPSTTDAETSSA